MNGRINIFMTKPSQKNLPDVRVDLRVNLIPSGLTTMTAPGHQVMRVCDGIWIMLLVLHEISL